MSKYLPVKDVKLKWRRGYRGTHHGYHPRYKDDVWEARFSVIRRLPYNQWVIVSGDFNSYRGKADTLAEAKEKALQYAKLDQKNRKRLSTGIKPKKKRRRR